MITALLILPAGFMKGVELNFPGVPVEGQFLSLPEPMVREKAQNAMLDGKTNHGTVLFQINAVEWRVERLYGPALMVVRLTYRAGA